MAQIEKVLTQKQYCDFMKSLPFWKGGTKYMAKLPYNCLYHATNDILWGDCVCLVKATVWGKATIPEKGKNWYLPGKYGLEDLTCEQLIDICDRESTNFKEIIPAEILYIKGENGIDHIGSYVGDFSFKWNDREWICNVIEATPSFENGILATYMDENGNRFNGKGGPAGGRWHKHGRLPWIQYPEDKVAYDVRQENGKTLVSANGIDVLEISSTVSVKKL